MHLLAIQFVAAMSGCATHSIEPEEIVLPIDDPVYTKPQRLVEVEPGRRLNIYCTGRGSPTVIFDSGQAGETSEWGLIQPNIAKRVRACTYDRAGIGFSDPAKRPSDSSNIVDDLHRLLVAASVKPPYVLVGHSYGGMNVKLFAYRYQSEVAGIVFVDPSHEDFLENARKRDPRQLSVVDYQKLNIERALTRLRECIANVPIGFVPGTKLYKNCIGDDDPRYSAAINSAHVRMYEKVGYQEANMSEEESIFRASAEQLRANRRQLGDLPIVVLTADTLGRDSKEVDLPTTPLFLSLKALHEDIASLSSQGISRVVRKSKHNVHTDQPKSVVDAIFQIIVAADSKK